MDFQWLEPPRIDWQAEVVVEEGYRTPLSLHVDHEERNVEVVEDEL
jgi:hypothetical protein